MRRKLLIFLALFALGAALLMWIDSRSGSSGPAREDGPSPQVPPPPATGEMTELKDGQGKAVQTAISGPLDIFGRDISDPTRALKRYHLVARDSKTLGEGAVDLIGVRFEVFDPPTGNLQAVVTADSARARLRSGPHGVELDGEYPLTLRNTALTYEAGSRFAPVTLTVPTLQAIVDLQRASSDDEVVIEGRGLHATGKGLDLAGLSEQITIRSEPSATVAMEDGTVMSLKSRGPLTIRARDDLGPEMTQIEATDSALLQLGGDHPLQLSADLVRLFGRVERTETSRFLPTLGQAEGNVRLHPNEGTFAGTHAEVSFDALGHPSHAALDGTPTAEIVLRGEQITSLPGDLLREGETLTVTLEGAGPLELFFEERERFSYNGPAVLQVPSLGARMSCEEAIAGSLGEDGRFHELVATQNVRFDYEQLELTTDWLALRSYYDLEDHPAVRLETRGPTDIRGPLPDTRPFELHAERRLIVERTRDGFRVPEADGVTLAIRGEHWVTARADTVRDLDVSSNSFVAEGSVEVENELGRGRGERFEAWAIDRAELSGQADAPAHFEFEHGTFEAQFVELNQTLVHARGDAHADLHYAGLDYDLVARWVVLQSKPKLEDRRAPADVLLDAGGGVKLTQSNAGQRVTLTAESFRAEASEVEDEKGEKRFQPNLAVASGGVQFEYADPLPLFDGRGERLELRGDKTGRLEPKEGERVELHGHTLGRQERFDLTAARLDFAPDWVFASDPVIDFEGLDLGFDERMLQPELHRVHVVAGRMAIDRQSATFSEGVSFQGAAPELGAWSLDARVAFLHRRPPLPEGEPKPEGWNELQDLIASGGVRVVVESIGKAQGHTLTLQADSRTLSLVGSDEEDGEREVVLQRGNVAWHSPRIDLDLQSGFLRSGAGSLRSAQDDPEGWTLHYEAIEPLVSGDESIQILRNPSWQTGETELRANWALLWLDPAEWRKLSGGASDNVTRDPDAPRTRQLPTRMLGGMPMREAGRWIHEAYLDGDVEYRIQGERKARADGMYLDFVEQHGWARDFALNVAAPIGGRTYQLKVQAKWVRSSLDGTLQARNAVATTCTHDVPHYVIRNDGFTVKPRYKKVQKLNKRTGETREVEELDGWDLEMDGNEISFFGGIGVPLPRIAGPMNDKYEFDRDAFTVGSFRLPSFGNDSKFGTFISTSFTSDIGWFVKGFHRLLNLLVSPSVKLPEARGSTHTGVRVDSRGLDVGWESEFQSPGKYDWSTLFDAIYDTGEDHGLVRVDQSDRSEFRGWLRTRGRFLLGAHEWIDAVLTYQTDPGVQAEFFESEYLRYEERETYLHWRKADDTRYWSATLEVRLEDFRTEVTEQPSVGLFRGRSEIGHIGSLPVVEMSNYSLARLDRKEGDLRYERPFFDGLGDRSVVRADLQQRYEMPWRTGTMGIAVTPFIDARATGWSDNAAQDDVAALATLTAGVETSTSFWKTYANGSRHVVSPAVTIRGDIASVDHGLPVALYDLNDVPGVDPALPVGNVDLSTLPIEGNFLDLALRSRWENRELKSDLDIEVVQTLADDVPTGLHDGWQPLAARGTLLTLLFGKPFGITHDGRYDTASGLTNYSRTYMGIEPVPDLDVELGYNTARNFLDQSDRLYNAATAGARYRFSPKWEVEGKETWSISDNGDRLASSLTMRRFGHDFVVEIETSFVAGEGGGSLHFNLTPMFAWGRSDLSMLDRWRAARQ